MFRSLKVGAGVRPPLLFSKEESIMASNRIGRINEEIQRELSALLRTLKDPRVVKPANPENETLNTEDEQE